MRDLQDLYDAVDAAIVAGEGILPTEQLSLAAEAVDDLRMRRGHLGDTLIVAIAGGTGSGKSSLLNAIAGSPIASVSRTRPHTNRPLAWIPDDADGGTDLLLDTLEVADHDRHRHRVLPGVALIDLPDVDSTTPAHRRLVEDLLPRVDAFLWVLDPEKYRDPELHRAFLVPLARYADQTVFVLNKIDLLGGEALDMILSDATVALVDAGYMEPRLLATAADPPGAPRGIDDVVRLLGKELDGKRVATGKLLADIATILRQLGSDAGVWRGASVRFEERWGRARDAAVAALVPGAATPSEDALCRLEDLVAAIASEVDPETARQVRYQGSAERIREAATAAQEAATADGGPTSADVLDARLMASVGEVLRRRAEFAGRLAAAGVGAQQLAHRQGVTSW